MKFVLDVIRSEIKIVGRKFDEFASGSLAYQYADLIAQDDYLGAMLKKHKDDLCVLKSDARAMDFFESGYDRAMNCDSSPVCNRPDTVEFWQYVINIDQSIFDVEESCQTMVKCWNESQHSYCDI